MAITTKLLHLRPPRRPFRHPSLRLFSSSSGDSGDSPPSPPPSSPFSDVKASLKSPPPPQPPQRRPSQNPPNSSDPPPKIESFADIQKNLSEFRRRSDPSGSPLQPSRPVSFQELYKRNESLKGGEDRSKGFEFGAIRDSLRNLKPKSGGGGGLGSFTSFNDALNMKLGQKGSTIGGSEGLPTNVFGREMKGEDGIGGGSSGEFLKAYSREELGKKLVELRPEKKSEEKNWFSLEELNERLRKLRDSDEKEMQEGPKSHFKEIRQSLIKIVKSDMEKKSSINVQRLDMFNSTGSGQDFMLSPPKEDLVEKYFHPDNMSAEEKFKIELQKVRDEFKMSESDCGSSRVQVAVLTTKIKYLSSVLHKKDKHSRRGLFQMVQQRKKLLKYLRRTDWDSYCMLLSKLGLRDTPDVRRQPGFGIN